MAEDTGECGPVVSIDIDDTVQLLLKNDEEVRNSSDHSSGFIFMVPKVYRDLSPSSFTPRVVSIGPLHHKDEPLKAFEVQKATYMHNLLHNILSPLDSTPEQILKECVSKVSGSVDRIKARYFGMQPYPDSELVPMMVTDACFILSFLYKPYVYNYSSLGPIDLLRGHIVPDMILIENQIPFFVLEDIFEITLLKLRPTRPLAKYISLILEYCNIFERDLVMDDSSISSTYDHILGFLHESYQNPDNSHSTRVPQIEKAHSAVELVRSGVRFSSKRDAKWRMAMELCFPLSWSKPTLKMPVLLIDDKTELILRNLIIYEQSSEVEQACVTSYVFALDCLIDTPEDVTMLVRSQALVNYLGTDEEAAGIINTIWKEVYIKAFYYEDEWKKMDEYYNAYWPKLIADMRRKYFSNPWSIIALIAGIVLFVLTVVQTIYGVKAEDSKAA